MKTKFYKSIDILIKYRYYLFPAVFLALSLSAIHGLSLAVWDNYFPYDQQTYYLGYLRPISSDVWATIIPQTLSQIRNGFPLYNYEISETGMNALLAHLPSYDPASLLGQSVFWGYYIFGADIGVAWKYWSPIIGLLLYSYEISFYLSKSKRLSFVASIAIALSPTILWWNGNILGDILLYSQGMVASCIIYYKYDNWIKKICSILIFTTSTIGFITAFSPSLQVPLGILAAIIVLGVIIENRKKALQFVNIIPFVFSAVVICVTVGTSLWMSKEAIVSLSTTVFPGERFEIGGNESTIHLIYSVFQFLNPFKEPIGSNQCEASSFFPVWFVMVVIVISGVMAIKERSERSLLFAALSYYYLFCISWLFFKYPPFLAKISLFSNVTSGRLYWTIGPLSIYLMVIWLSNKKKPFQLKETCIWSLLICLFFLRLFQNDPYFSNYIDNNFSYIILGLLFVFVICFSLLKKNKKIICMLICLTSILNILSINPISRGIDTIESKDISLMIKDINNQHPDSNWVYCAGYPYNNFLAANGVRSLFSTNMYMDEAKWRIVDPERKFTDVYNRYCHVSVGIGDSTSFNVLNPDLIHVTLTPNDLYNLNIDYVLTNTSLDDFSFQHGNILELESIIDNVYIYHLCSDKYVSFTGLDYGELTPSTPLLVGDHYEQSFTGKGNYLTEMQILFGTYDRVNSSSVLMEITEDGQNNIIYSDIIHCDELIDNTIATYYFEDVQIEDQTQYTVSFYPIDNNDYDDFITIYQTSMSDSVELGICIYSSD